MSATIEEQARAALDGVRLTPASAIRCQPIRWLWPGWLARGKLHILAGAPGTGKTTAALALAATITRGGRWPDGTVAPPGRVLVWSGEDDPADTLVPRLRAAGADLGRVLIVGDTLTEEEPRPFDPARDLQTLEWQLERYDDVALMIADPVVSAVAGDSHKNVEVRRSLQPLVNLGQRLDCAVLGISHFTKGSAGRDPTERVTGSIAFGALARIVLVTAKGEDGDRLLARAKSNIGQDGGGYRYTLEQIDIGGGMEASTVRWGEAIEGSAREILSDVEAAEDRDDPATDAAGFLFELLRYGARPAREVLSEAVDAGFSRDQMHRAKRKIGAVAVKLGMAGGWAWQLPKIAEDSEQDSPPSSLPSGVSNTNTATFEDREDREDSAKSCSPSSAIFADGGGRGGPFQTDSIAAKRARILARFGRAGEEVAMDHTRVIDGLIAACTDAGVDPEVAFAHLDDADVVEYGAALSDGTLPADRLPGFMRSLSASIAAGRCLCSRCKAERGQP